MYNASVVYLVKEFGANYSPFNGSLIVYDISLALTAFAYYPFVVLRRTMLKFSQNKPSEFSVIKSCSAGTE
jgi:hypothetical protein